MSIYCGGHCILETCAVRRLEIFRSAFDPLGRVITLVEATGASLPVVTTIDSYDPGGRKTSSTKQGIVTTYTNDAANRLLGQTVAGRVATFSYDPIGNTQVKWYQGQYAQTMTYDVASRLVTMILGAAYTTYTYDQAGNQTTESAGGNRLRLRWREPLEEGGDSAIRGDDILVRRGRTAAELSETRTADKYDRLGRKRLSGGDLSHADESNLLSR